MLASTKTAPVFFALLCCLGCALSGCRARKETARLDAITSPPPAKGRSLFDHAIAFAPNQTVPYPFTALLTHLDKYGDRVAILGPLGRSEQKTAGMPDPFADPRRLIGYNNRKGSILDLGNKLFIGYVRGAKQLEVISYNESSGDLEFQFVTDYDQGLTPKVYYANRHLCMRCHQDGGVLFSQRPWSEFNGNKVISSLILRHHPKGAIDGIPIVQPLFFLRQQVTPFDGGATSNEFESILLRATRLITDKFVWKNICPKNPAPCRATLVKQAIRTFLNIKPDLISDIMDLESTINARFPKTALKDRDIFSDVGVNTPFGSAKRKKVDLDYTYWLPPDEGLKQTWSQDLLAKNGLLTLKALLLRMDRDQFERVETNVLNASGISLSRSSKNKTDLTPNDTLFAEQFIIQNAIKKPLASDLNPESVREDKFLMLSVVADSLSKRIRTDAASPLREAASVNNGKTTKSLNIKLIDKAIDDLVKTDNSDLLRSDFPDFFKIINEILVKLKAAPLALPQDDDALVRKVAQQGGMLSQSPSSGPLKTLFTHCGKCHATLQDEALTAHGVKNVPQFLAGANPEDICENVSANMSDIISALKRGYTDRQKMPPEQSYMPPASDTENSAFTSNLRSALLRELENTSEKEWCP